MSRSRSSPDEPATGSALELGSRNPLARIAYILGPVAGSTSFAPAGDGWSRPSSETAAWGRPASPSGTARGPAIRSAIARERALRDARRRGATVHRLPPQRLTGAGLRNAARDALLGGALVVEAAGRDARVLDHVATAAGVEVLPEAMHLSSGGSVVARVRASGADAVLRIGIADAPGDPSRGAAGLAHLAALEGPFPRLLGTGRTAGAAWTLESARPGRRVFLLTPSLASQVAAVCAALPAGSGPPGASRRDLEALAGLLPEREDAFLALARSLRGELRSVPSILRHGDLWLGNLLADDRGLSGVVDWDAWDPGSVPGSDVLHLHATSRRIEERCELGEIWAKRPWRDEAFRSILGGPAREVPDDVLAIAWWAGEVRGTVSRHIARATDERWLAVNVDAVLRALRP